MHEVYTRAQERSEEHTSELQSLRHLVCRLLLEKKNELWSMVFASGGHMFKPPSELLFAGEDKTALMVLEWMLDAFLSFFFLVPGGPQVPPPFPPPASFS